MEESEQAIRARLLASLPPEARASGERLLALAERDFSSWYTTTAIMALGSVMKRESKEQFQKDFDVLREALTFFRLAVEVEQARFSIEQITAHGANAVLRSLPQAASEGLEKMEQSVQRLARLIELQLEEASNARE